MMLLVLKRSLLLPVILIFVPGLTVWQIPYVLIWEKMRSKLIPFIFFVEGEQTGSKGWSGKMMDISCCIKVRSRSVSVTKDRIRSSFYYRAAVSLAYGRTHDSSQKAGETIEKSTGLYFVTFVHNVEISDCFPSGKRSLPFPFFFVFWKPGLFYTKKQTMFF